MQIYIGFGKKTIIPPIAIYIVALKGENKALWFLLSDKNHTTQVSPTGHLDDMVILLDTTYMVQTVPSSELSLGRKPTLTISWRRLGSKDKFRSNRRVTFVRICIIKSTDFCNIIITRVRVVLFYSQMTHLILIGNQLG